MPDEPTPTWAQALRSRRFVTVGLGCLALLVPVLISLNRFLRFNEQRTGVRLIDPVLDALPAADLSALFEFEREPVLSGAG